LIRPAVLLGKLGWLVLIVGAAMLSCLPWSLAYNENVTIPILEAAILTIVCGALLTSLSPKNEQITYKEGFAVVSLGWLLVSIFGTLPYLFSGYLGSFADAFFETVSGFTTTGASVVTDVEAGPGVCCSGGASPSGLAVLVLSPSSLLSWPV
jgi:trk system potassium uptake protein TrkH